MSSVLCYLLLLFYIMVFSLETSFYLWSFRISHFLLVLILEIHYLSSTSAFITSSLSPSFSITYLSLGYYVIFCVSWRFIASSYIHCYLLLCFVYLPFGFFFVCVHRFFFILSVFYSHMYHFLLSCIYYHFLSFLFFSFVLFGCKPQVSLAIINLLIKLSYYNFSFRVSKLFYCNISEVWSIC